MMLAICFLISTPFTTVSFGEGNRDYIIKAAPNVTDNPLQAEKLKGYPSNWGKWGPDDEIGTLNYLTPEVVAKASQAIKSGKVFTLQRVWKGGANDPIFPGRTGMVRFNAADFGTYLDGKYPSKWLSDMWYGDDWFGAWTHGTSHIDALGHGTYGNQIYNGYPAETSFTKYTKASVLPLAEKGIVARGVLLDVARFKGKGTGEWLAPGTQITFKDLMDTAKAQGVTIQPNDWLLIRTGWLNTFDKDPKFHAANIINEPGITAEKELVEWWAKLPIIGWSSDTIACEQTTSSVTGTLLPLHGALLRNLGSTMNEIVTLEKLAEDCAKDGQYTGLFIASPLKIDGATGAPTNPVFIK
ncbi:MAG: cyclase family protein [Deltaproteobacteria bacterium]|nr:cyclase family protein [Deltaproteobacteria bacterium]